MGKIHSMRVRWLIGCAVAVLVVVMPDTAQGATPNRGAWESRGNVDPRVAFEVAGPSRRRAVLRVSVPLRCRGELVGWGWTALRVPVRLGGRFTGFGFDFDLRARFVTRNRAEIRVRMTDRNCRETRSYVAFRHASRVRVRVGRYLALLGAGEPVGQVAGGQGAAVYLDVDAFGRMLWIEFLEGAVPAACDDGSRRLMPLTAPEDTVLAAPIRPGGRFEIAGAAGATSVRIFGTATDASLAAFAYFTAVMPDGVRCRARGLTMVGALNFPEDDGGESSIFPPTVGSRVEPLG
jgi:hypothetical protein